MLGASRWPQVRFGSRARPASGQGPGDAGARGNSGADGNRSIGPDPRPRVTRSQAPGTCGELIHGAIDGRDFLVNCPIDRFALATVGDADDDGLQVRGAGQWPKAIAAISALATSRGVTLRETLEIGGSIPRGRGMASSTADISAALSAFCRHRGLTLDSAAFGALVASIEPSDCVHYRGIAEVDHLTGKLHALWPAPRRLRVLVVDGGGAVGPVAVDRERARAIHAEHRDTVQRFLSRMRCGLMLGTLAPVGEAATLSARLSQHIAPRPAFEPLAQLAASVGALGVNCAHRGSVLGVLYAQTDAGPGLGELLLQRIGDEFGSDLPVIGDHQVIAGGCRAVW